MLSIYIGCLAFGAIYAVLSALLGAFDFNHGGDTGVGDISDGGVDIGSIDHNIDGLNVGNGADLSNSIHGANASTGDSPDSTSHGPSPLNPLVVGSSITAFGAFGVIGSSALSFPEPFAAMFAALCAAGLGTAVFFGVVKLMYSTQSNTIFSRNSLIGTVGQVITPIPGKGVGEIAYIAGGSRLNAAARSLDGIDLKRNEKVVIVGYENNALIVSKAMTIDEPLSGRFNEQENDRNDSISDKN